VLICLLCIWNGSGEKSEERSWRRLRWKRIGEQKKWKKLCQYLFKFISFAKYEASKKRGERMRWNLIAGHLKAISELLTFGIPLGFCTHLLPQPLHFDFDFEFRFCLRREKQNKSPLFSFCFYILLIRWRVDC